MDQQMTVDYLTTSYKLQVVGSRYIYTEVESPVEHEPHFLVFPLLPGACYLLDVRVLDLERGAVFFFWFCVFCFCSVLVVALLPLSWPSPPSSFAKNNDQTAPIDKNGAKATNARLCAVPLRAWTYTLHTSVVKTTSQLMLLWHVFCHPDHTKSSTLPLVALRPTTICVT